MKGQIKRIISIVLIVAMTISNNGLMVLADSVESIVNETTIHAKETPNYYFEQTTTIEEYQAYLETKNPDVFDDEKEEQQENVEEPEEDETKNSEGSYDEEKESDNEESTTVQTSEDLDETTKEEVEEKESEETTKEETEGQESEETSREETTTTESREESESKEDAESISESETTIKKDSESDETKQSESKESESKESESEESESKESESKESETTVAVETTKESEKVSDDTASVSDAEETKKEDVETETATKSETDDLTKVETKEKTATESETLQEEKEKKIATESETTLDENVDEKNEATESELKKVTATESELLELTSTASEVVKQQIIATVSKVSWKLKKVLIATFASVNVSAKETEKNRMARLATYANVILVNDKGEEKVFKVNLKWQLLKKYEVNAKSDKKEAPISKNVWRKNLKVDDFIKEQEEVILSTSNIAVVEERVKAENTKHEDKEYVIKLQSIEENIDETKTENETTENTETTVSPAVEDSTPVDNIDNSETIDSIDNTETVESIETEESIEEETYEETESIIETSIEETIKEIIEETVLESIIVEPTVAGFVNTDEETVDELEIKTATESTTEEESAESDEIKVTEKVIATKSLVSKAEEKELSVDAMTTNGNEISDSTINYYDLQNIYLYKIDVPSLGEEIIEVLNNANSEEEVEEKQDSKDTTDEKPQGVLEGIMKFFGINLGANADAKAEDKKDESEKTDDLMTYLSKAQVDVLEEVKLESIVAEFDEHLLGAGANHDAHQIGEAIVKGTVLTPDNIFDTRIGGEPSDMLDLSPSNKRITASGSNILIAGTYYLPGDVKISNQWIVEEANTLTLCLNGHNITFATAGCVRGEGRVIVCNCGDNATITTNGPQYNWRDKWYASTSETYTKWNERSLFAGKEVGIYAKNNNIIFANAVIQNQYNGRKSIDQMEETEMDEPEYSGEGSLVYGKKELQVYGVKFENNKATRSNGVAANAQLGKMILEDCLFEGNKNLSNRGGAVAFNPKSTIIYNCEFKNNIAFTNGGALYGRSYTNSKEGTEIGTRIAKTSFKGNVALVDGGAIFMDYLCAKGVTIDGTQADKVVFENNYAGVSGGAIAVKHMRSVDGQDTNAYSYEDPTSRGRLLNINYATFNGNAAKGIKFDSKTGIVTEDSSSRKENHGGAIYLSSETVKYNTFPTDLPVKEVNIKNSTFKNNLAKGYELEIKAKDPTSGDFVGDTLAKYYVGNSGGAIYASKVAAINISETEFDENKSLTGASLCVKESTVSVVGGALSKGKAYNSEYAATEFYKRIVSPGGGAAYVMKDAHIAISKNTKIKDNENAFYLDGGSIDLGASEVESNIGEYLIGYTNYKTNRILFSGVDIRDHEFNETRKDYASTLSDATIGPREYENGIYAPSYISFKDKNVINYNKRNYYTKSGTSWTNKHESANLVMISSASNLQMDLSKYLFDVPFTAQDVSERIGLYYEFDPNGEDQIIAFDKWNYTNVKVIDEGGLWTNYFEIDNSKESEWAEGWKFYIEKNLIRMSPNIVQVKFDSYIEDVPRIKPQYYNFRKSGGQKIKIATPTEIVRRDIHTPGKTLLGFLGVDKTDSTNTKYDIWDFDRCVIDPLSAVDNEIVIILLYTNDTIQIKPCGCANGTTCVHDGTTSTHTDRGTATNDAEARYLNYIEVATYPQLQYRYGGRKTQYSLSKDLKLTAAQAREFIEGGMVLNLNGKTLTYDTTEGNDSYIFSTTGTDTMRDANDAKVMICGIATPGATKRGKIVANGAHKGAFIIGDKDIYLSSLDVKNIAATNDSNKAFIHSDSAAIDSYIYTNDVTFDNVNLKSDLISAGSRVVLENTKIKNTTLTGNVVKLQANGNVNTELKLLSSEINGLQDANALLAANLVSPRVGTKVKIATSTIANNTFESYMIDLTNGTNGANSSIKLQGNVNITNNTLNNGTALIYNEATDGEDEFGTSVNDNINITNNTVPHNDNVTVVGFYEKSVTFKGKVVFTDNKTTKSGKATKKVSTVMAGHNTTAYLDEVVFRVAENKTLYEWFAENNDGSTQTFNTPIFTQVPGTKLRASDSIIKIRLKDNSEDQGQKIYEHWSIDNIIGEKEAEVTFMRDDSYSEDDPFDIYKKGTSSKESDIYLGSSFVAVRFRLYNYKEDVDERLDPTAGYTQAAIQRVEPDVYTLLDTPQYRFDFSRTSVMWEAFAYRKDNGDYDYSKERLYPEKTTNIAIRSTRSVLVSGYIYNYNNKRHVHEGNVELWTEARNEGHLQATNSFVFLHNDIEITHPLLFTPETTYHLCLNGHKLIINTDTEWFNSNTCNLIICDCKKTGSIVQTSGVITKDVIKVNGGSLKINDITVGPFTSVQNGRFLKVEETARTSIDNIIVKEVNLANTVVVNSSFIDIDTNNIASISNITLQSNKMTSNDDYNAIFSVNNLLNNGEMILKGLNLERNEINAESLNGAGYIFRLNGYENVTLESPIVRFNKSVLGAPIEVRGNSALTSTLNMNNVTFTQNEKVYYSNNPGHTMILGDQLTEGASANFATTKFSRFNINGGTFSGNKFNKNSATLSNDEGAVIDFVNYESTLTVKNVTFDGTGTGEATNMYGIVILDRSDELFENVTFTNYNIGDAIYMQLLKGSAYSPAGTYVGRTTFRGNTKFTNNNVMSMVNVENIRNDLDNENEGLVLFNKTVFTDNTAKAAGLINASTDIVVIATGANITKTNGTAVMASGLVGASEIRLINTEISGGTGTRPAVYMSESSSLVVGDKVVVKGNATNIYLEGDGTNNAKIKALSGHPILGTSDINISVPDIEYNFFDEWSATNIEKYNYHSKTVYTYLPSDLFKLDEALANGRKVYISGDLASGNQKLWISRTTTNQYATLIFFDKDIKGPKEITRQHIMVGQKTKLDRVQVDYISTLSQVWMTESDGSHPEEQEMWRLYSNGHYNEFEVNNYEAGKTYYAYLTKKHIHKICGPDSLIPCGPNHADGVVHTEDLEIIQVGTNENIIYEASRSNYIGLSNNLTITQEALDSMSDRDIVFCINGYTLSFEENASITTNHSFTLVNCESTGAITVKDNGQTSRPFVSVSGAGNTFSLYNIHFDNFKTSEAIVEMRDVKIVSENIQFTNITSSAPKGVYDIESGTAYVQDLTFTDNIATGSALLDLRFDNFTVGKIGDIEISNNNYTNKLLSLDGTGNMDSIVVNNNTMIAGGGSESYGAIFVATQANITYTNDALISSNDASINEESKGGALSVYGRLNFNGNVTLENNKAGLGGAIYVEKRGRINVTGEALFKANEARIGGAIYSEDWTKVNMASAIYDENVASVHGVVAFGNIYSGAATFKNHTRRSKELIYNINDDGSDSINVDANTIFIDNTLTESIMNLRNVSGGNVELSYLNTGNYVKNFIELSTGSITIDNSNITDNTFTDSVFNFTDPVNVRIASISVYENKITTAIISVKGGAVDIGNRMTFTNNAVRLGKKKELYVSGEGGYYRATEQISMGKKYLISAYTNGIKVFEKWNAATIENYDNPQNTEPGRYMVTPDNSDTIKLSEEAVDLGYALYKVGNTDSQDIYIGKEGVDFIQLRFIDPDNGDALFASQNIEIGKETKLDKVDILECNLDKQRWVATMSDGTAKTLVFTTTQYASSSESIDVVYMRPHLHKICGLGSNEACNHMDGTSHTEIEYQIVSSPEEFATTTDEYVYIKRDMVFTATVSLADSIKGICLNGYSLTIVGNSEYSLFDISKDFAICNCKLSGGITTDGDSVQEKPIINFKGTTTALSVYNIDFYGINTNKSVINLVNDGSTLYANNLTFKDSIDLGEDSAININNNNIVYLDNITFENNKNSSDNQMLDVYSGYHISTLSFINNDTKSRLAWFRNNSLVDIGNLIVKNNKVDQDSMLMYFSSGSKFAVSGDMLFENNTTIGDTTLSIDTHVELDVNGDMSFINNTANKHAAMFIDQNTVILARQMLFDGNKNTVANNAIVQWSDSKLVLNNTVFKNHPNETDILLANEIGSGNSKIYMTNPTFINNKGTALKLDEVADARLDRININKNSSNNFTNVLDITASSVSVTNFMVEDSKLVGSAIILNDVNDVTLENVNINKNTISTQDVSALKVTGATSVVKVKGTISVDGNTKNISLADGSYLKAVAMVKDKSKMNFEINGTSQKLFEGWDKNHIESFGKIASKSIPRRYSYTPENSGLFAIREQSGYAIYKGGTGDTVSVYAGDSNSYGVLSFVFVSEEGLESTIETQNVIKGATTAPSTILDTVDSFEYELDHQTWYAPNSSTGAHDVKWEFKNEVVSTINGDADIKYVRKHIHKLCGAKYYDECKHPETTTVHNNTVVYVDASSSDVAYWPSTAEYINLLNDIVFTGRLNITNLKGICLNGHKIIIDNIDNNFMSISSELNICDCKHNQSDEGAIAVKTDVILKNSIIRVNNGGILNAYNIRFKDISLNDYEDFTITNTYAIENANNGHVYLEKPIFTGGTRTGRDGLFKNSGSANNFKVIEPMFTGITIYTSSPLLNLTSHFNIATISVIKNDGYAIPLIKVTDDVSVGSFVLLNNTGATGQGLVSIDEGKTLTLTEDNIFEGNKSQGGGVIRVAGTLVAEKDLIFKNNITVSGSGNGGALYLDTNGRVITRGKTSFIGNEALRGSAIYGESIKENALIDMKEPYFEKNIALTMGVIYWSGSLKLATPTFAKHEPYSSAAGGTGVRTGLIVNNSDGDKLVIDGPTFVNNNLSGTNAASAIRVKGLALGSKISGFDNRTKNNNMANLIDAESCNLTISGDLSGSSLSNKFSDSIMKIKDARNTTLENLVLENQVADTAAVSISGAPVFVKGQVKVNNNKNSSKADTKNIYLADISSYLVGSGSSGAVSYIDEDSEMSISTAVTGSVKVFEGWIEYNFEHYDNPDVKNVNYKYVYTPENSKVFVVGSQQKTQGYEFYKKGYNGDGDGNGDIYLGTNEHFVKLKYYNDVEEVEDYVEKVGDKEYYGYQNIAKGVATKLDKVDSHEYEIAKQEWYVGYESKDTFDHYEKYNPASPQPTVVGANGVVETFDEDQEIKYHQFHIHKICGLKLSEDCQHDGHADHTTTVEFNDVQTIEELEAASGYAVLVRDLDIANMQRALRINSSLEGICLNGHTIMGDGRFGLFDIDHAFTICDCKFEKGTGGITSDESFTQAIDIININTTEEVGLYRLTIKDVGFGAGLAVDVEQGNVFIGGLKLTGCTVAGSNGVIRSAVNTTAIDKLELNKNNMTGSNPLVKITSTTPIKNLTVTENNMDDSIVVVDADITIKNADINKNTSANKGAIYVAPAKTLTFEKVSSIQQNKALKGGAIYNAGTVEFEENTEFKSNTATQDGGAIYMEKNSSIVANGKLTFDSNNAKNGGAIYAEELTIDDLDMPESVFKNNAATVDGSAIAFGGELELSNASFTQGKSGASYISNINKTSARDKASISNVSFVGNTITGSAISLTNVKDGTRVQNIVAKNNKLANLVEFKNVDTANRVYVTNLTEVTGNTFTNAGVTFDNVGYGVINNITMSNNTSSGYGTLLVKGANTRIFSVGELTYSNNTNTGKYGAAISIVDKADLDEDGGMTITANKSKEGGAIYLDGTLGVQAQSSKPLKVSGNFINSTTDTKNIYVTNADSYVYATGKLSDDTLLGFTAGAVNVTAFKYWNSTYISKIGTTDKFAYTPENCGLFLVDTLSKNANQELYKSGVGNNVVVKLGANFTKLNFVSAGKTSKYSTQNIERGVDTKLDTVLVSKTSEKWIAPNDAEESDYKWSFSKGDVIANYSSEEEDIYMLFTYSIVYTGGSKPGTKTYNNIEYGEALYADENTFVGNDFKYWLLREPVGTMNDKYYPGDFMKNLTNIENRTAYLDARWGNEIRIKFDPNGERYGLDIPIDPKYNIETIIGQEEVLDLTYPTSLGGEEYNHYTYNTKADGSGRKFEVGDTAAFDDDTTLYLIWEKLIPTYTITFDPNGGKGTYDPIVIEEGTEINLPGDVFTRDMYKMSGWIDETGKTYNFDDKYIVVSDMTFKAKWTPYYTLTFDPNGGTGTYAPAVVLEGEEYTLPGAVFKKDAYEMTCWSDTSGKIYTFESSYKVMSDMTFKAEWTPYHTLTFDPNGGQGSYGPVAVLDGKEFTLPGEVFTRDKYKMTAWMDEDGNIYEFGDKYKVVSDMTFDAQWTPYYTLTFNPNGGTGTYGPVSVLENTEFTLPKSVFSRDRYYMSGWKDERGSKYDLGGKVVITKDKRFSAMWEREEGGGGGTGGGGSSGGRISGGTINPADLLPGPGVMLNPLTVVGVYTIDEQGNIRDAAQNIVGNIYYGDRVNADGSFTAASGITIYPNGAVVDVFGNIYNPDGSITTAVGTTYYVNGDIKDATGTIYHVDGSITLPNGTVKDANGIVHYPDGSIMLPDGTTYYVDGTVLSPGGIQIDQLGKIVPEEVNASKQTPGSWGYDPSTNNWKFENTNADGTKTTYKDQWISTKNTKGEDAWYTVDRDGNMVTGWLKSDGEYYFMSNDSKSRGELVTGTVTIDGKTYTFDSETGALKTGEPPVKNFSVLGAENHIAGVDGNWKTYETGEKYYVFYFDMPDGSQLEVPPSSWYMVDGNYYYFDKYGIPQTGLVVYDDKYYYFNEDGKMKEGGEVTIGDTTYVFDKATGACRTMRKN